MTTRADLSLMFPSSWRHRLLPIVMLALAGCDTVTEQGVQPRPVRAVQVESVETLKNLAFNANVVSRQDTPLSFQVGGRLSLRQVSSGDRVEIGQALLTLDSSDLELQVSRFEAEIKVALAEQRTANTDLQRFQKLQGSQFVSPTDLDQAGNRYSASSGRLNGVEAQLALAKRQLDYATVGATYSGWVNDLTVEVGQVVTAGEPLGQLQSDQLELIFGLPEQYLGKLRLGDTLEAIFWGCDECSSSATVREIGGAASGTTGTLPVKASLNVDFDQLRPGMTARVVLSKKLPADALVIPQLAVVKMSAQPAVWVVATNSGPTASGRQQPSAIELRPITLGEFINDKVLVTQGLALGEWVVTAGQQVLSAQQTVRILE